jgi:hypothetical protein
MMPPPPCREHHRLALQLLDESTGMLQRLRAAVLSHDTVALTAGVSGAQALEVRTRELEALGAGLKRRFGLAP